MSNCPLASMVIGDHNRVHKTWFLYCQRIVMLCPSFREALESIRQMQLLVKGSNFFVLAIKGRSSYPDKNGSVRKHGSRMIHKLIISKMHQKDHIIWESNQTLFTQYKSLS